jgi:hypothetical protein
MTQSSIDGREGACIGYVDGSTEASTNRFSVVLEDQATVQLDDLVVMSRRLANGDEVAHYGIVVEVRSVLDGATIASDTKLIAADRTLPGAPSTSVDVQVLRTLPELWVPPESGAEVRLARGSDRDKALFADQMKGTLPMGVDQGGQPVYIDWTFLNGEAGAHVSISGISGVASKTSFAMSILYHLFETQKGQDLMGMGGSNARALVLNVKGEDLLHLDRLNGRLDSYPKALEQWKAMGVEDPGPFHSVQFYVPQVPGGHSGGIVPNVSQRTAQEVTVYGWTPLEFVRKGLMEYCIEDEARNSQVPFIEQRVRLEMARRYRPVANNPGAIVFREPVSRSTDVARAAATARQAISTEPDEEPIETFADLVDFLGVMLDPSQPTEWQGALQPATLLAFMRRLHAQVQRMGHLVTTGLTTVSLDKHVTVVDIHTLHDSAQRFVVGAILGEIFDAKQGAGREPLRFIVLDELNKFCPREGHSPVKDLLVDVGARGRSLGVILIGAQQAMNEVDGNVIRNASIKVVGRLDAGETEGYRFLNTELRERASRFLPGTMVLSQPLIPAPIPFRFPFPGFATCKAEADAARVAALEGDRSLDAMFDKR